MKSLKTYITESKAQLDLTGISKCSGGSKYEIADKQAEIVVKELSNKIPDIDWRLVDSSDTKKNLEMGDINGFKDDKLVYMIDLKVAESNNKGYIGTIDLNSILHFANKDKSIYLCVTCDGSKYETFWGKDVYNKFMGSEPTLLQTKHENRDKEIDKSLNKYDDKFISGKVDGVSPYDFMSTKVLNKLKKELNSMVK